MPSTAGASSSGGGARIAAGSAGGDDAPRGWVLAGRRLVTFHIVCLAWVFFRADSIDAAFELLGRLGSGLGSTELVTPLVLLAILGMLALQYAPPVPAVRLRSALSRIGPVAQGAAAAIVLFFITTLGPQGVSPFIYFRF